MRTLTGALITLALLGSTAAHGQAWPADTCPQSAGLIQNGDFNLKEVISTPVPFYSLESFVALDVCSWTTNGGPLSGSMNRDARLVGLPEREGVQRFAKLYHAVHLVPPHYRDPTFIKQTLAAPLPLGVYTLSFRIAATQPFVVGPTNPVGIMAGLTAAPLTSDNDPSNYLGNPLHYTALDELAPMFGQVVYQSPTNEFSGSTWNEVSVTFNVTETGLQHLYLFPIVHGEFDAISAKRIDKMFVDDVVLTDVTQSPLKA